MTKSIQNERDRRVLELYEKVLEIEQRLIPTGLHVFGRPSNSTEIADLLRMIASFDRPELEIRSLPDLVALSRAAKLMVSGDTGPTHIAAAVGTPVVALFGPTNPGRNGPWDEDDVVVSRYEACGCHYERKCSRDAAHWCLSTITERDTRQAIEARLQRAADRSIAAGRSTS